MPCQSDGPSEREQQIAENKRTLGVALDETEVATRVACEALEALRAARRTQQLSQLALQWEYRHRIRDLARNDRLTVEQHRRKGLGKLTLAERRALGLL